MDLVCRRDAALNPWAGSIEARGAHVHRSDLRGPADIRAMRRVMRRGDLVHVVLAYPSGKYQLVAALLARAAGRPLVVTHQLALDVRDVPMPAARRALWRLGFRAYGRLARFNIASSQAGLDLLRRYGYPPRSSVLIYNGGDLSLFRPLRPDERRRARQAVGTELAGEAWTDEILFCCTVARMSVQKGMPDLVQAAAAVAGALPEVRFVLVGDGELREQLQRDVSRRKLERQVLFAGTRPLAVLPAWLGAADLFVLASHFEGMPLSMIEAMAAGCPVVATTVGGIPEVMGDATAGKLIPPGDPPRLAEAIEGVLRDSEGRCAMRTAARQRAEAFDVRTCYQKTVELYQQAG